MANEYEIACSHNKNNPKVEYIHDHYLSRGWYVMPCHGVRDGVCLCNKGKDCKAPGKHPRYPAWKEKASNDIIDVWGWFYRMNPQDNVAIVAGKASNLTILDVDSKEAWEALKKYNPPRTALTRTSKGFHLYYQHVEGSKNKTRILDKLDIRGEGGYAIAAPSVHVSGKQYRFAPAEIAELPDSLKELILKGTKKTKTSKRAERKNLKKTIAEIKAVEEGSRHNTFFAIAARYAKFCESEEEVISELCDAMVQDGFDEAEATQCCIDGWAKRKERLVSPNGGYYVTDSNTMNFIENCYKIRYDVRGKEIQWSEDPPWRTNAIGKVIEDTDIAKICTGLANNEEYEYRVNIESVAKCLNYIAQQNSYDPVVDYLRSLRWDLRPRLDTVLQQYAGVEDKELYRVGWAKWAISAVARVMEPGCKADMMVVLCGAQGAGKSRLAAILGGEWGIDPHLDLRSKSAEECLVGGWIVEVAEMGMLKGDNAERAKAFVSRKDDYYREPYKPTARKFPRRCVFIGTTNHTDFLWESAGARRYMRLDVGKINLGKIVKIRDQLWAEAVARYDADENWYIEDEGLVAEFRVEQKKYVPAEIWEPDILEYLTGPWRPRGDLKESPQERGSVTTSEIAKYALGIEPEKLDSGKQRRIAQVLLDFGCKQIQKREGEKRIRIYVLP